VLSSMTKVFRAFGSSLPSMRYLTSHNMPRCANTVPILCLYCANTVPILCQYCEMDATKSRGLLNPHLCNYCRWPFEEAQRAGYSEWVDSGDGEYALSSGNREKQEHTPHKRNIREFVQSASAGCHICCLFLSQLTPKQRDHVRSRVRRCGSVRLTGASITLSPRR
jgi:hypothetical protein